MGLTGKQVRCERCSNRQTITTANGRETCEECGYVLYEPEKDDAWKGVW